MTKKLPISLVKRISKATYPYIDPLEEMHKEINKHRMIDGLEVVIQEQALFEILFRKLEDSFNVDKTAEQAEDSDLQIDVMLKLYRQARDYSRNFTSIFDAL